MPYTDPIHQKATAMYAVSMIFLLVVGSFIAGIVLSGFVNGSWNEKQQLKIIHKVNAIASLPKHGEYTVSTEEYYLIH